MPLRTFFVLSSGGFGGVPALAPSGGLRQRLSLVVGLAWLGATPLVRWHGSRLGEVGG